ncbi:O-antigen polysaccharide polymerase Wzy family protein [Agromyces italicus]|uniref:O-antigen polysaccharide polymerase Wzy family protein n=1 Tax=Agromyces italicus TaxID=279572 RepID=UPI0003B6FA81|nr:O-antigen polysaccharide polymerase Wzy family protein [Agromyces italicus]
MVSNAVVWLLVLLASVAAAFAWMANEPLPLLGALLALILSIGIWVLSGLDTRYALGAFVACMVVFLVGRMVIAAVFGSEGRAVGILGTNFRDPAIVSYSIAAIFVACLGMMLGAMAVALLARAPKTTMSRDDPARIRPLRTTAIVLLAFAVPSYALQSLALASFVGSSGFYEVRLNYQSPLPLPIAVLASVLDVAFFGYLATMPSRRHVGIASAAYLGALATSLLTWQRADFMLGALTVLVYVFFRNATETTGRRWITGRGVAVALVAFLPMVALLGLVNQLRGRTTGSTFPGFGIVDFFFDQGVSVNVIGYVKEFESLIPQGRYYSFGSPIELWMSRVAPLFGSGQEFVGQSAERAADGHQLAHTISYIVMPQVYLTGSGYGSSFVAELIVDFGFAGLAIGALILGAILMVIPRWMQRGWFARLLSLLLVQQLLFAPRASLTQWVVLPFSPPVLAVLILMLVVWTFSGYQGRLGVARVDRSRHVV